MKEPPPYRTRRVLACGNKLHHTCPSSSLEYCGVLPRPQGGCGSSTNSTDGIANTGNERFHYLRKGGVRSKRIVECSVRSVEVNAVAATPDRTLQSCFKRHAILARVCGNSREPSEGRGRTPPKRIDKQRAGAF